MENTTLKPYADYKPSGIEWLGDVPTHWDVKRLKNVGYLKSGAGFPHSHQGNLSAEFSFFKVGDMAVSGNERLMQVWKHTVSLDTVNVLGAHVFLPDTIVFAKVGAALLLNRRRLLTRPSCIDNNMMGFLPRGHSAEWMCHWLSTVDFRMVVNPGAVPSVNEGQLEVLPVLVPPLDEQTAIVRYLDHTDDRIRRAISAKERLVELLTEQRQTVIHRAVTRGLDPDVPLKDSGVEWLGEVPAHWEVLALKRLAYFRSGAGFPVEDQGSSDHELPFFKVSDMNLTGNERIMKTWNNSVTNDVAGRLGATVFRSGTIIFPKVGGALLTNKRRVVERPCCIDNNLMGCTVYRGDPRFDLLLLENIDLGKIAKPGPVPAISESEVRNIRAVMPPITEQAAIVCYLDKATSDIDTAIDKAQRQIDLLREYRTRLIADVVTGQVDVRGAVRDEVELPVS